MLDSMTTSEQQSTSDSIHAHFAAFTPRQEMESTINGAVWHAARRELGLQEIGRCANPCCEDQPPFDQAQWLLEREDADLNRRVHLLAIQYANSVGLDPIGWVGNARKTGATWQQVADALGVSRQAAHERFARFGDSYSGVVGD